MFLHAGAGLHGHEFSGQTDTQNPQPRRFPLLRSALRPLADMTDSRPVDTLPSSPPLGRPSLSRDSPQPSLSSRRRPLSELTPRRDLSVRFQEPPMEPSPSPAPTLVSDDESIAGSERSACTTASGQKRGRKRLPGDSSRFALAHPAPHPRTRQRTLVQIRPRVLLQLQRLSQQRPVPAFEVVPSSIVSGSIIVPRLAKRFPRIFRAKAELGPDDLLILRSEDYNSPLAELEPDDDHQLDNREIIAVVSPLPQRGDDGAEIVLEDGSAWTTSLLSNGSYEFRSVDGQGRITAARWVKREVRSRARSLSSEYGDFSPLPSPAPAESKWTFSVIDPTTRRHPILGVLTRSELEVYHTYCTLSSSSGRNPPTRSFDLSKKDRVMRSMTPPIEERMTVPVSGEHKRLMMVTASWINLRQEGWPASNHSRIRRAMPRCRSSSTSSTDRRRSSPFPDVASIGPFSRPPSAQRMVGTDAARVGAPAEPGALQRRLSAGAAFMQKRRMSLDITEKVDFEINGTSTPSPSVSTASPPTVTSIPIENKPNQCRMVVRRITQRIFNRKAVKEGDFPLMAE